MTRLCPLSHPSPLDGCARARSGVTREEYLVLTMKKYHDGLILGIYAWFLMVENIMGFRKI